MKKFPEKFIDVHTHLPVDNTPEMDIFNAALEKLHDCGMERVITFSTHHSNPRRWEHVSVDEHYSEWRRLVKWRDQYPQQRYALAFVFSNTFNSRESLHDYLKTARDDGALGVKIGVNAKSDETGNIHKSINWVMEFIADNNLTCLFHTYLRPYKMVPGELEPADIVTIAGNFPEAKILMAHAGADYQRTLPLFADVKNLHVDISGIRTYSTLVANAVKYLGCDRICYGSDMFVRSAWSQLAMLQNSGLDQSVIDKIAYNNAKELFWS